VAACVVCAAGSITSTGSEPGASACTECAVGKYSEASAPGLGECTQCTPGR
jgi:hypothetical protein